jgi:hypothetical protein
MKFVLVAITIIISVGCQRYPQDLGNDYALVRCNASDIAIFSIDEDDETRTQIYIKDTPQKHILTGRPVPPKIIAYGKEGNVVYGKIIRIPENENALKRYNFSSDFSGYFILNTSNRTCILGLSDKEWQDKLKNDNGIAKISMRELSKNGLLFISKNYSSSVPLSKNNDSIEQN